MILEHRPERDGGGRGKASGMVWRPGTSSSVAGTERRTRKPSGNAMRAILGWQVVWCLEGAREPGHFIRVT